MPCEFDKGLLDAYVDGELPAADAKNVEEHIASCEECRAEVDALRKLSGDIKAAASREAPRAALTAIRASIEREEMRRRRFVFAYRALAAAAVVMLVAAISFRSYRESEKEEFDRIARVKPSGLREDKAAELEIAPEKKLQPPARTLVDREAPVTETFAAKKEEAFAHVAQQPSPTAAPLKRAAAPAVSLKDAGAVEKAPVFAETRTAPEPQALDEARSFEADALTMEGAPGRAGGKALTRRRTLAKAPTALKEQRVEAEARPVKGLVRTKALGTASIDDGAGIPAEGAGRKKRGEAELAIYETILRKAFDAAVQFRYEEAVSAIEHGFAALTDKTLRQGLSTYREMVRLEADLFETVAGRLSRGKVDIMMHFPGEGNLTVVGIETGGVVLRSASLERMIYPWNRLSNYQKLRLFEMCANEKDAGEMLALASVAFHKGIVSEAEKKLAAASNLTSDLKEKVATRRGLFNKLKTLMHPIRARSSRSEEKAE